MSIVKTSLFLSALSALILSMSGCASQQSPIDFIIHETKPYLVESPNPALQQVDNTYEASSVSQSALPTQS